MARRHFLFGQGNATPFYLRLGQAAVAAGHGVARLNLCGGDRFFWGGWNAWDYGGRSDDYGAFVADILRRSGASDLVVCNDCRPCNAVTLAEARRQGLAVHVFEEGYLRPNWITLERDGLNGNSRLPDDPAWYHAAARALPAEETIVAVGSGLSRRVRYDFEWQAANYLYRFRFPHYRTHRPFPIWAEYATWIPRLTRLKRLKAEAEAAVADLIARRRRFFLFPLQLDSDSQIRIHSPFGRMRIALEAVLRDFAAQADAETWLVIKNHPLDNNWVNLQRLTHRLAVESGVAERVLFLDGGSLPLLLDHAAGVVTVNSTVGLIALARHCPVIALGKAVFDLPGLTFQGPLSAFWHHPDRPDPTLLAAYQAVLRHACLINGDFYTDTGVELAIAHSLARMTSATDLLADAPPRRAPVSRVQIPSASDSA